MTKPFNESPPLFRSLGADNSKSQARSRTAASEAEERWPLFKAVAPAKPASLPAMGEDDKRQWERGAAAGISKPRPALSVPDVSGKMALGLNRMGTARVPARTQRAVEAPAAPVFPAAQVVPDTPAVAVPAARAPLFARATPLQTPRSTATATIPAAEREQAPAAARPKGLFAHLAPPATTVEVPAPAPVADPDDRSLSAIFQRLERSDAPAAIETAAPQRAGFLGRLGRK